MKWDIGVIIICLLFVALTSPIVLAVGGFWDLFALSIAVVTAPCLLGVFFALEMDKIGEKQK